MTREEIFEEISAERNYQDGKFGTEFDDKNTNNDWIAYITAYAGRGYSMYPKAFAPDFRKAMLKVAALAVAAIEAHEAREERARSTL